MSKICTRCKKDRPAEDFYKYDRGRDGLQSQCKECQKKTGAAWRSRNRDKVLAAYKRSYAKHKEKRIADTLARRKKGDNARKHMLRNRKSAEKRAQRDPVFALKNNLRALINISLRERNYTKKSRTHEILGADYLTVSAHLAYTCFRRYRKWPTDIAEPLHIDHIVPLSSATTEEELLGLNHYKNLQLLISADNLAKSDKLDWTPETCLTSAS